MQTFRIAKDKDGVFTGRAGGLLPGSLPVLAGMAVGVAVVCSPLMGTAVVFAGLAALLLGLVRPDWALYLYFCGVVVMTDDVPTRVVDSFFLPDADMIEGLPSALTTFFLLMFGVTVVRLMLIEQRRPPVALLPLAVITVIVCVAFVTGIFHGGDPELYRVDFFGMLIPVFTFCICLTLFDRREKIERLIDVLMAVAAVKALILAGYYLAGLGWIYKLDSLAGYRITTMDSADLLVFITLPLIVMHRIVRSDLHGYKAALSITACVPMLYVVVFSYRRAQWVGLALSAGLLWLGASKAVRSKISLLLLALLLLGSAVAVTAGLDADKAARIVSRITSIFDSRQSSNVYHVLESRRVLQDLAGSPLFGLGLGSEHSPLGLYEEDEVPANVVHNTFLYIWMKIGLAGLFFFLWFAGRFVRRVLRFRQEHIHSREWGLVLPLAASSGVWLAMFLTGPTPWYLHQTGLIALFAAMAVALMRQAEQRENVKGVAGERSNRQ